MPEPIEFNALTPRHALPLIFSGQAQKELYLNEAHTLIDALLHMAIVGSDNAPPASSSPGDCWRVIPTATGDWADKEDQIALFTGSEWIFMAPREGMQVFDTSSGQRFSYIGSWKSASQPSTPTGGGTIDSQSRTAINGIIDALKDAGILAST